MRQRAGVGLLFDDSSVLPANAFRAVLRRIRMTATNNDEQNRRFDGANRCPLLTADLPGIEGAIKDTPEDFEVEEIPAYLPCGEGEHLFLWIEKRGVAAERLTSQISRTLNIPKSALGTAGLKDRCAVTRQYVSVPASCEPEVERLNAEDVRVLHARRHRNKLRTGHLKGNRFSIRARNVSDDAFNRASVVAERLEKLGVPNYFGPQRFGTDGETVRLGLALLRGERSPQQLPRSRRRFLLRMSLSAAQSWLFNRALSERMTDGLLHQVLAGDVMQVTATGGPFVAEDVIREQQRYDRRETLLTGALFGPKMLEPAGETARREARVLEEAQLSEVDFRRFRKFTPGTRRPYLVQPSGLSIEPEAYGLRFRFTLPSGSYATAILREFMKRS